MHTNGEVLIARSLFTQRSWSARGCKNFVDRYRKDFWIFSLELAQFEIRVRVDRLGYALNVNMRKLAYLSDAQVCVLPLCKDLGGIFETTFGFIRTPQLLLEFLRLLSIYFARVINIDQDPDEDQHGQQDHDDPRGQDIIDDGAVKAGVDSDFFLLFNGSPRRFFRLGDDDADEDDDVISGFSCSCCS